MTLAPTIGLLTDTGTPLSRAVSVVTLAVPVLLIGLFPSLADLGPRRERQFRNQSRAVH